VAVTTYNKQTKKAVFADSTDATVSFLRVYKVTVDGATGYVDDGDTSVTGLTGLPASASYLASGTAVATTSDYVASTNAGVLSLKAATTKDITLVRAYTVKMSGNIAATAGGDSIAKDASALVAENTVLTITGTMTSDGGNVYVALLGEDAKANKVILDQKATDTVNDTNPQTYTYTVTADANLDEDEVYHVTLLGNDMGYVLDGVDVEVKTSVRAAAVFAMINDVITAVDSANDKGQYVIYTVDAFNDEDTKTAGTITLVEAYEVKAQSNTNSAIYTDSACASKDKVGADTKFEYGTTLYVKADDTYALDSTDGLSVVDSENGIYSFTVTSAVDDDAFSASAVPST
jgi:hypothetical protein